MLRILADRNLTCQYLASTLNSIDSGCDSGRESGRDSGCSTQSSEFNNALADFSPKAAGRCTGLAQLACDADVLASIPLDDDDEWVW